MTSNTLAPYQVRVLAERDELNIKLEKLTEFLKTDGFRSLSLGERNRLVKQQCAMSSYSSVLAERIAHFHKED